MKRLIPHPRPRALALAAAACSAAPAPPRRHPPAAPAAPTPSSIVAKDLKFDQTAASRSRPARRSRSSSTTRKAPRTTWRSHRQLGRAAEVFKGEIVSSATKVTYDVPALAAGTYFFRCDVHPDMKGTITAE